MFYKQTMKILNAKGKKIKERETKRIKEKKRQTMQAQRINDSKPN